MRDTSRKQAYRPRGEVRRLLLRAARELSRRGYRGPTTPISRLLDEIVAYMLHGSD